MSQTLLEIKIREGVPLAPNQELHIKQGEIIRIHGDSGEGKSSLLRALVLLPFQINAEVFFRGKPLEPSDITTFRRQVQLVPQTPVFPASTVEDILTQAFSFDTSGSTDFNEEEARHLSETLLLSKINRSQSVRELSGGEKSRLALLRSLLLKPTIMLLDEPFAHLDQRTAGLVMETLKRDFMSAEHAMVIVSHQSIREEEFGFRVRSLKMKEGKLQ